MTDEMEAALHVLASDHKRDWRTGEVAVAMKRSVPSAGNWLASLSKVGLAVRVASKPLTWRITDRGLVAMPVRQNAAIDTKASP